MLLFTLNSWMEIDQIFYIACIFYRFAWLADPVVHIYSWKLLEMKIFRKRRRNTGVPQR